MIDGQGAAGPGPDLSHIGAQPYDGLGNTPAYLARFLADPAAEKPGTQMPKVPLSQAELDSLVHFLVSLK
jgi:cytochrome c oxidase subunit 2